MVFKNKILVFFILVFLLLGGDVFAKSYFYKSIEVDIQINKDSTFDVVENQTYNLNGNFGYFYRDIKLKNLDHISDIEVFDGNGKKLNNNEYKISNKGGYISIRWDFQRKDFNNELKSWIVKYKVHGGLGFYDNYDELYWNAVFADGREVPVEYAEVMVYLPEDIKEINKRLFIGPLNSKTEGFNYEIINNNSVKFWGNNIAPTDFFTIVVSWPKGIVEKPFLYRNQLINWIVLIIALMFPVFIFIKSYKTWKESGKDAKTEKTIIAQYDPPNNISPALIGVLIKQNVDIKDILATVVDLAVRGYLKIIEQENKVLFFKSKEYIFEKIKDESDLKPFEQKIVKAIFKEKNIVSSNDLRNKFYKDIPKIKKSILNEINQSTNYFSGNIDKIRGKYMLPYILIFFGIFGLFVLFFVILSNYIVYSFIFGLSLAVSSIIGLLFGYYMPALTIEGAEAKWHALGFKEYLHTAERFRIGAETIETFSKFLPYAMIFGVEKEWAKRFSDFSFENQNWYVPMAYVGHNMPSVNSISDFSSSFSSFASSISSAFNSSPGGGSGMGGGGGAGGGGGGGGGGAG